MFACQPQPVFPILYMPSINCVSYSLWSSVAIACVTLFIPVCLFLNIPWPLYHCLRFTCVPVYPSLRLNFYPSLCLFVNPSLCYPGYPSLPYLHACPSLCVLACVPVFSSLSSCVSYNVFLCILPCFYFRGQECFSRWHACLLGHKLHGPVSQPLFSYCTSQYPSRAPQGFSCIPNLDILSL